MSANYTKRVVLSGVSGIVQIPMPQGLYNYVTINNPTDCILHVYAGLFAVNVSNSADKIIVVNPNAAVTVPLPVDGNITVEFMSGAGTEKKEAFFIYTEISLNANATIGQSSRGGVDILTDSVGLAREATLQNVAKDSTLQALQSAVTGVAKDSTLATVAKDTTLQAVQTAVTGVAKDSTLATVAKDTTLQAVQTAVTGVAKDSTLANVAKDTTLASTNTKLDNIISKLGYTDGVSSQLVTASAAGDITVKASGGKVYGVKIKSNSPGVKVVIKDGATERWEVEGSSGGLPPILCGTSIILTFSAAGSAYIQYQ